jgi:predicted Zn-ribbon and HTH transcriptional regulator
MIVPRQFVECCLCGHKFNAPSEIKDLEKCPKCRGRRLVLRVELTKVPKRPARQVPVVHHKGT